MKKLLVLALSAVGAIVFKSQLDRREADARLWAEATSDLPGTQDHSTRG